MRNVGAGAARPPPTVGALYTLDGAGRGATAAGGRTSREGAPGVTPGVVGRSAGWTAFPGAGDTPGVVGRGAGWIALPGAGTTSGSRGAAFGVPRGLNSGRVSTRGGSPFWRCRLICWRIMGVKGRWA